VGKRGPKKTPTSILEKRGSWLAKTRQGEPVVSADYPPCPDWIKGEARDIWDRVVPQLVNLGVMTKLDGFAFSRYCVYSVLWLKELGNPGRTEATLERYANQCSKLEAEFGLTPSSRSGLDVKKPEGIADKFLKAI
jgi:phage terminase small subunit